MLLLKHGAAVDAANNDGTTPLFIAAVNGHTAIVRALLLAGADASIKTKRGDTPLMIAEQDGHHEVAALLNGGKPMADAFWWACFRGEMQTVWDSLTQGADPNAVDQKGSRPSTARPRTGTWRCARC
jgi:hypothetical protein